MTEKKEGKTVDNKEKSLFLFFPQTDQLPSVFTSHKVLTRLTVIGQNVESIEGIEELKNLEELWIVECGLQQEKVEPISKCIGLKRLYLYDNELTAIPNLELLTKLTHLWLSHNSLESCQGINSLLNVREINLSNNNIGHIDVKLKSSLKITFMNLAGNPIRSIKEIQKLESLRRLRWLVLSDPLSRMSPVAQLANLRHMVVHCLPNLEKLDMLHISPVERMQTARFIDDKLEYYRSSLHNSLAKLYNMQKNTIDSEIKEFETIWNALRSHCSSIEKDDGCKSNNLRFWEDEGHRWKERLKLIHNKFNKLTQVITMGVNLEVESCGNLKFLEIDLTEIGVKTKLKNKILSYVCSNFKENVLDINLQNAWSIQGHYQNTVFQSQYRDCLENVYITCSVRDLDTDLLKLIHDILFGCVLLEELPLTDCIAHADPLVSDNAILHRQSLLRSQVLLSPRLMVISGINDQSQLTVKEPRHPGCKQWTLTDSSSLVPLYLLHYQYVFQDYFKPLKMPPVEAPSNQALMSVPLDTNLSQNITVLKLMACNLQKLDIPIMEHVTSVDLSYNQFQDISSVGPLFPKLTSLNVSFNRIYSLLNLQGLQCVTQFALSWNFLSDFLCTLSVLKGLSSLKYLDMRNNPFRDVTCDLHQQYFICTHLKSLMSFNDSPLSRSLVRGEIMLQGKDQFPMVPAWRRHKSLVSLRWKAELSETNNENHLGVINNQVISITLKGLKMTQYRSAVSLSKLRWLDMTNNLFSGATSALKASSALEEVNLSHNVIEGFSSSSDRFKHLTKLNLSHNYITSLNNFTGQSFPQLKFLDVSNNRLQSLVGLSDLKSLRELYLSHNRLHDASTFVNCKDMVELRVLDVSYNPMVEKDSFKRICLFHINSLKYINGSKVGLSEAKSAISLYEGFLDQDYLIRVNKGAMIDNLTLLSLPNCSIKKVHLPGVTLPNMKSLTLDHNQITSLSWVQSFPNLVRLSLSHNRVASFGPTSPSPSPSFATLKSLILDNNHIKHLPALKLYMFPCLQLLKLTNNEISSLSGLKNNPMLEHLVLDNNKLLMITSEQTSQLENLLELYLERNSLTKLEFLKPLTKLRKLFIGHNKLVAKSCLDTLRDLPHLEELTIHGNPIVRSCKSYGDVLPSIPSLQLLEGHTVNR